MYVCMYAYIRTHTYIHMKAIRHTCTWSVLFSCVLFDHSNQAIDTMDNKVPLVYCMPMRF